MNVLPEGTELGRLRITEVLDYYDGPRLFTAANLSGSLFLVFLCGRTVDQDAWLYVPISSARLGSLKRGELTLRDAIVEPEGSVAYEVTVPAGRKTASVRAVLPSNDSLPPPDDFLELAEDVPT